MKKAHLPTKNRGFSLVEILVALSVFLVFVLATLGLSSDIARSARHTANSERAAVLAEEAIEVSRNLRDANPSFSTLPDGTYGLDISGNQWNLSGSSDTQGIFTRSVTISAINGSQKKVTATVSWADQVSQTNSVTTNTYLTNWRAPLNIGLTVDKTVVNHGGTSVPSDFLPVNLTTLAWDNTVDPPVQNSIDIPIVFSPTTMTLGSGVYTFLTSSDPNYNLVLSPDCTGNSVTLGDGDAKLCNITYEEYYVPTLTTPTSASITETTATLGASVTSLGLPTPISARGICYNTAGSPTLINGASCVTATLAQTLTPYTVGVTGLTSGTTYKFAGYATNPTGTGYSTEGTFVTSSPTPAITFVGQTTAGGTTATIPARNAGDLIIVFAYRDGNAVAPTVPTGWTTISSSGSASANSSVLAYQIAPSTAGVTTSTNWLKASEIVVQVYRGTSASPIGATLSQAGSGTTVTYPALPLNVTNGTSWVIGFAGHRSINTNLQNAPTGMTARSNRVDAIAEVAGHDTNSGVSSWSAKNVLIGGTSSGWMTRVLEIKSQ